MLIKKWEDLPVEFKQKQIKPYYDALRKKNFSLFIKRLFDILLSGIMLVVLSPLFIFLAIAIKCDSKGPVFYRQERITQYNRTFKIFKFRSMVVNADKGSLITGDNDSRITKIGKFIRKCRLDEISQLINVFIGDMTFVGTRPEVKKYVDVYTPKMLATLLLPAGITSLASIKYKDEATLLDKAKDTDKVYIEKVLPAKMKYNVKELKKVGLFHDITIMIKTVFAVL